MEPPALEELGLAPTAHAVLDEAHARRVARTFDLADDVLADGALPLTWLWAWFTPTAATAALRSDGHPAGPPDGVLAGLDRRMFVGGRLQRHGDLHIGANAVRTTRVLSAEEKRGSTGTFVVVEIEHRYSRADSPIATERQQLLYRTAPTAQVPRVGEATDDHAIGAAQVVVPDERLLFRFSALTFNSHRIHYDLPYATGTESYPGLVVHGPLTATLLEALAAGQLARPLDSFSFRATAPTFAGVPLALHATSSDADGTIALRAVRVDGTEVMAATATAS